VFAGSEPAVGDSDQILLTIAWLFYWRLSNAVRRCWLVDHGRGLESKRYGLLLEVELDLLTR